METPGTALVVTPHPDDAEGSCGGTAAKWIKQGSDVFYVLCTDGGRGSSDPEMTSERLAVIRDEEQLEAASTLGVREVVRLRHPDGELEDTREFRKEIVRAIRRFRPDVIMCPDPYRRVSHWHRDHRISGLVTADAAFPYARDRLHFYELFEEEGLQPHKTGIVLFWSPDVPDTFIDIGETIDIKIEALLCHKSQISELNKVGQTIKEEAKRRAEGTGFEYAEAFRKIEFRC